MTGTQADFDNIFQAIRADEQNGEFTRQGIDPLYTASATSRLVIIGQAPGRVAQETRIPWNDKSGDRLRDWLGIDRATFYDPSAVALLPMDFYYPGKGKSGDLPPRRGFAEKWHPVLLGMMPQVRLTVLVGSYAQLCRLPAALLPACASLSQKPALDEPEPLVRDGRPAAPSQRGRIGAARIGERARYRLAATTGSEK